MLSESIQPGYPGYIIKAVLEEHSISKLRVTMQDIADRVGLSKMSVSLALRGSPKLAAGTIERVRKVAMEMGYVPDPLLRALNVHKQQLRPANRGEVIAVLDNWCTATAQSGAWAQAVMPAIELSATRMGYVPHRFSLQQQSAEQLQRILRARGISCIILMPDEHGADPCVFSRLDLRDFCVVRLGRSQCSQIITTVTHDQFAAMQSVVESCHAHGYQRPAFVQFAYQQHASHVRYASAFRSAVDTFTSLVSLPVLTLDDGPFNAGALDWFVRRHHPDVIIGTDTRLYRLLTESGYSVPRQLGFACLESSDSADGLSGVHINAGQMACAALELIERLLQTNCRGCLESSRTVEIGGIMVDGHTLLDNVRNPARQSNAYGCLTMAQGC